jgi:RNA polymerase sigma factor (TIGR02999 family)
MSIAINSALASSYDELRRLASRYLSDERVGHTLSPTELVHEAYLRLSEPKGAPDELRISRTEFFVHAAHRMRQILVDHARHRDAQKRGGTQLKRITLTGLIDSKLQELDVLALDQALDQLARLDARRAQVVQLRFFAGLEMAEIAEHLGVSRATAQRDWDVAKAYLFLALG